MREIQKIRRLEICLRRWELLNLLVPESERQKERLKIMVRLSCFTAGADCSSGGVALLGGIFQGNL